MASVSPSVSEFDSGSSSRGKVTTLSPVQIGIVKSRAIRPVTELLLEQTRLSLICQRPRLTSPRSTERSARSASSPSSTSPTPRSALVAHERALHNGCRKEKSTKALSSPPTVMKWRDERTGLLYTRADYVRACQIALNAIKRYYEMNLGGSSRDGLDQYRRAGIRACQGLGDVEALCDELDQQLLRLTGNEKTRSSWGEEKTEADWKRLIYQRLWYVRGQHMILRDDVYMARFGRAMIPIPKSLGDIDESLKYVEERIRKLGFRS
ncbi:hypothetical protein BJ508DRAFT_339925 [Ascobolus immersus RN42]|uniref:Uncharacterized protein n=1 Tax=Ascobolus immersus RN42 TaxID=1160509 RepID=A0A3N4IGK3_ASCIM|nr:hypothetical protein BJ508DRAFT_339925 [Ascobolus immersus RN42]